MDKHFFVELTNELYRLTLLFPQEEPLRLRIRELGDDILSDLITILEGDSKEKREAARRVQKNIEVLESLLVLAKEQKWVKEKEFEEVEEEYGKIKKELRKFNKVQKVRDKRTEKKSEQETKKKREEVPESESKVPTGSVSALNGRQKRILELLEKMNKVQVKDVEEFLEESVSKRTIRRDFKRLMEVGFAERFGEANRTYYKLKS